MYHPFHVHCASKSNNILENCTICTTAVKQHPLVHEYHPNSDIIVSKIADGVEIRFLQLLLNIYNKDKNEEVIKLVNHYSENEGVVYFLYFDSRKDWKILQKMKF